MQIITNAECVLLGIKENSGKDDKKYYEVSIEQNDSVCSLPTSADVYELAKIPENKLKKYTSCNFTFVFDTRFNNMRVLHIQAK